jgi:hypothetical protein
MELVVRSTASAAIAHLMERINVTTGFPVVHDPTQSHQECITEWRSQWNKRYHGQHHGHDDQHPNPDELSPTILGWNRSTLRYPNVSAGQRTAEINCVCPEIDSEGRLTGNAIAWSGFRGECTINFRLYSTDVRAVEAFEVLYMAKKLVSGIVSQKLFINGNYLDNGIDDPLVTEPTDGVAPCMSVDFQYEWDFANTSIQFVSDDNTYIQYEFECILRGAFVAGTGNSDVITVNPDGSTTVGKIKYVLETRHTSEMVADVDVAR